MKAVIFAGGFGTRISEESTVRPKPMVEIGGRPILWHILKIYSAHGINEFVICCGYKGHVIKEYFDSYILRHSDVTFDLARNHMNIHDMTAEPWRVTLIDTGENTMTGGRLKRVAKYLDNQPFCLTYGDGVTDLNISDTIAFHRKHGKLCTVTAMQPAGRWGALALAKDGVRVQEFREKPKGDGTWINGGFFVCEPKVLDYIEGDATVWEREPMMNLAREGQMNAFKHDGFWHPMDTLPDKHLLEGLWASGKAPWKVWA